MTVYIWDKFVQAHLHSRLLVSTPSSSNKTECGALLSHSAWPPSLCLISGEFGFTCKGNNYVKAFTGKISQITKTFQGIITNPLSFLLRQSHHCFGLLRRSLQEPNVESPSFLKMAEKQFGTSFFVSNKIIISKHFKHLFYWVNPAWKNECEIFQWPRNYFHEYLI